MRVFNFKAKNIGDEKYLTYIMGEETELDEDVLDYWEENKPKELVDVIYEEDDDYDYLTFDITDKVSLASYVTGIVSCEKILFLLRNVANNLISIKEQAIPLSYVLLNKEFIYVGDNYELKFICLPVESKGSLATEFKGFVRQLLANIKYDVEEDLNYVGKLLSYINSDAFNLRGLIGLSEALMEEAGISYEELGGIEADGVEVVNSEEPEYDETPEETGSFMDDLGDADVPLPEIEDEEEEADEEPETDDEELDSILPAGMTAITAEEETEEVEDEIEEIEEADEVEPEIEEIEEADEVEPEIEEIEEADEAEDEIEGIEEVEEAEDEIEEIEETEEVEDEIENIDETDEAEEATSFSFDEEVDEAEEINAEPTEEERIQKKLEETKPKKETDVNLIKSRIMELVGEVPSAKPSQNDHISSIKDLDEFLDSKPPVIKKNVVKVNRAAIIQNVAAAEQETEELSVEEATSSAGEDIKVPVIEEMYDDMNIEKKKPKSNSVLSKTVEDAPKTSLINMPKVNPYLIRVNTEERIMLTKLTFKIGKANRGVDYTVSGNGAISRQHAVIIQREGVCYIKDNKSTNHTYVNGRKVEEGEEEILTHDSMIKLGDEEFLFKIR